jgi:indolepyruvate ferredoxin oxidoreductase
VRREERRLVPWYRELVTGALDGVGPDGHARAIELARLPESIRGYEDIKLRSIAAAQARATALLDAEPPAPAAESQVSA